MNNHVSLQQIDRYSLKLYNNVSKLVKMGVL